MLQTADLALFNSEGKFEISAKYPQTDTELAIVKTPEIKESPNSKLNEFRTNCMSVEKYLELDHFQRDLVEVELKRDGEVELMGSLSL